MGTPITSSDITSNSVRKALMVEEPPARTDTGHNLRQAKAQSTDNSLIKTGCCNRTFHDHAPGTRNQQVASRQRLEGPCIMLRTLFSNRRYEVQTFAEIYLSEKEGIWMVVQMLSGEVQGTKRR